MVDFSPRTPYKGKGIHVQIDWGRAKEVLNPELYKEALNSAMLEAAELLMEETSKKAPVFHGMRPQTPTGTPLEDAGSLQKSISIRQMGNMILIISDHQAAKYIIEGHDALKQPGSIRWFFANYPYGYKDVKGNPVPPDDWTMSEEEGITFITEIVTKKIRTVIPGGD